MVDKREAGSTSGEKGRQPSRTKRQDALRLMRHMGDAGLALKGAKTFDEIFGTGDHDQATPPTNTTITLMPESARPPDPLGDVTLRMFEPFNRTDVCTLVKHYGGEQTVGAFARMLDPVKHASYERRVKGRVLDAEPERANTYDDERAQELVTIRSGLKRRINQNVYSLIQKEFNLADMEQAAEKFESARQYANQAVRGHLELTHPELDSDITRDIVKLRIRPADFLEMALTSEDRILRFELQRQFANTVLALQQERGRSVMADFKLSQIQELLEATLYAPPSRERTTTLYGEFRKDTNELIGGLYEGVPRTGSQEGHFKALPVQIRPLKNGMEVMEEIGTKGEGAGVRKAIRKTIEGVREQIQTAVSTIPDGETTPEVITFDDTIRPREQVKDTHRMTLVVLGGEKERDELAYQLLGKILAPENAEFFHDKDVLGDVIAPDGVPTGAPFDGEIKTENRGGIGQKKVNYVKLTIEFGHKPNPANVEIIIQDTESYFREKYEVGQYDAAVDDVTGPAHDPYAVAREKDIIEVYTPKQVYPHLRDKPNPAKTPVQLAADNVRQRNIY